MRERWIDFPQDFWNEVERIFEGAIRSTPHHDCYLDDIQVERLVECNAIEIRFGFNGQRWAAIRVDDDLVRRFPPYEQLSVECYRLYYEVYENFRVDAMRREALDNLNRAAAEHRDDSAEWRTAFEVYRSIEEHARTYHAPAFSAPPRRDLQYMGMQVIVDDWSSRPADAADHPDDLPLRVNRDFVDSDTEFSAVDIGPPDIYDLRQRIEALRQGYIGQTIFADLVFSGNRSLPSNKEAEEKAIKLLKENLTPKQLETYEKHGWFEVKGGDTGRTYRIYHGRQMNISVRNWRGKHKYGLCFLPTGGLVEGDIMLGQKVALELYENEALNVADKFHHDPGTCRDFSIW